jgi:nucleotide-binding universal stress UspA family protein
MASPDGPPRIVVGVDGSAGSLVALDWAVAEAKRAGGVIEAVLAYDSGLAWIDVGSEYQGVMMQHAEAQAEQRLQHALDDWGAGGPTGVRVHPVVIEGEPDRVLCERARGADLLVVGTRGRGGFAGLLLGSVSQRCAERSSCPVVVVPGPRPPTSDGAASNRA